MAAKAARRHWVAVGAVLFFILAPGTVAGLIPYSLTGWRVEGPRPRARSAVSREKP